MSKKKKYCIYVKSYDGCKYLGEMEFKGIQKACDYISSMSRIYADYQFRIDGFVLA